LENLKKDDLFKEIPVIVITTESSEEHMRNALDLGAKGFIRKPFLPEEVRKILYDVIGVSNEGEYEKDRGDDETFDF
jgi:two-component system chemotaxis response regulator CheY